LHPDDERHGFTGMHRFSVRWRPSGLRPIFAGIFPWSSARQDSVSGRLEPSDRRI
jgi:hypothetical protein